MAAKLNVKELLSLETPPELDDVPRRGLDENGALFKCVRSAEHWFKAYTDTEESLRLAERQLLIERAKVELLRPRFVVLALLASNVVQGVIWALAT